MAKQHQCPTCDQQQLDAGSCGSCGGRLIAESVLPQAAQDALAQARPRDRAPQLQCPQCADGMAALDSRGVVVDRCAACRLVWLDASDAAPGELSMGDLALFALSMPERAARGLLGGVGGAVHEAAQVFLPHSLRGSLLYRSAVAKSLKFLVEDIGGIEDRFEAGAAPKVEVARVAVGGFLDTAGMVVLHASPIWVLAAFSDVTRGTKTYLRELNDELVRQQVLPEGTVVDGIEDLLESLEQVSGRLAKDVDQPPLSVDALRASFGEIKSEIAKVGPDKVFPREDLERTWQAMTEVSEREGRSIFEVSTAIAIASSGVTKLATTAWASVTVGADMLYEGVFKHYLDTLSEIHEHGYYATIADASGPYLRGIGDNLRTSRESFTERLFSGRLFKGWWGKNAAEQDCPDSTVSDREG